MVSKNILVQIIIRVIAVSTTCLVFTWQLFEGSLIISAIIFGIIIAQIIMLVNFLNSINRKLAFFFDAVQNEDSTMYFPEKVRNRSLRELNQSLNKVNSMIQKVTLENREQEQYFHTIIEQVATGILIYDEEGHIHTVNSAAKQLLRYEYLTHIRQLGRVDNKLLQLFREIKPSDRKLFHLADEKGTMQLSLRATFIKLRDKKMTLVAIQDVKNELDEKELESWIKLIRVLTHEIMNSVAPITSLSESVAKYYRVKKVMKKPVEINETIIRNTLKGLDVIRERGKGLIGFVESYRRLTRLPKPAKKTIKLKPFMDRVNLLVSTIDHFDWISFSADIQPENLEIYADEKLLTQVIINLVNNSIQALEGQDNGQIKIVARNDELERPVIHVVDNGPGIAPHVIEEIFIPFFTTKENGSGIGLSLSRQIMKLHGGSIKVKSVPNKQTVFTLIF